MRRGERTRGHPVAAVLGATAAMAALALSGSGAAASAETAGGLRPYKLTVDAVAYHLPGRTASGIPCGRGVVAVDPGIIPLGTPMRVPGYGWGLAADVGTAVKGRIIDLWMPTDAAARRWGRKTVTITVYR